MFVLAAPRRLSLSGSAAHPQLHLGNVSKRTGTASLPRRSDAPPLEQEDGALARRPAISSRASVPPAERHRIRRLGWSAAAVLGAAMAGHTLLETARDALFLRSLPATRLPWAYLVIAALTGLCIRKRRDGRAFALRGGQQERLMSTLLVVAVGTVVAGLTLESRSASAAFGFYVWTGIAATLTALRFWVLLGTSVNRCSAERLYGPIAVGGSIGATLGAVLAGGLLRHFAPEALIIFASAFFAAATALAVFLPTDRPPHALGETKAPRLPELPAATHTLARGLGASIPWASTLGPQASSQTSGDAGAPGGSHHQPQRAAPTRLNAQALLRDPLVLALATLGFCATLTLTSADYLVKATVASEISGDALGRFFAKFYAALNLACLGVQVVVAPWFLRVMGVTRSLAALPLFMLSATLGLVCLGGLVPVLLLKAADGTLRGPVYRTASEVLYVHLPAETLERVKALIDSAGHRLAQAVASLVLLVAASLGLGLHQMALALFALGLAWLGCVLWLIPRQAHGRDAVYA